MGVCGRSEEQAAQSHMVPWEPAAKRRRGLGPSPDSTPSMSEGRHEVRAIGCPVLVHQADASRADDVNTELMLLIAATIMTPGYDDDIQQVFMGHDDVSRDQLTLFALSA